MKQLPHLPERAAPRQRIARVGFALTALAGLLIGLAGCSVGQASAPVAQANIAVAQANVAVAQAHTPVAQANAAVAQAQSAVTPVPTQGAHPLVVVQARVVPVRSVELAFPLRGVVIAEVPVEVGDTVVKGAMLARLDTADLQLRVDMARTGLARAEAEYNRLAAGATPADLEQARASIAAAQARLRQAQGSVNPNDLADARRQLAAAQARRAELEAGPKQVDLQAARAARDQAQSRRDELRASLAAAVEQAAGLVGAAAHQLELAQQELSVAEQSYQQTVVVGQPGWQLCESRPCTMPPPSDVRTQALAAELERRQSAVSDAEAALERARLGYEAARERERSGMGDAEAALAAAQAHLDQLLAGSDSAELERVRAAEAEAAARLAQLQGSTSTTTDEAAANVRAAQAHLADLAAGAPSTDLAVAATGVELARVQVRQAERELEKATLVAPMDGVVAEVNLVPGEIFSGDTPVVVLADTSAWQIETGELTDLDVVNVTLGARVVVSFEALPDLELSGKVSRISPLGKQDKGEALYTASITLDSRDARLRWNMPVLVRITS